LKKNFSNLKVILVEPNGPLNVGSVARLCSNFEVEVAKNKYVMSVQFDPLHDPENNFTKI